MTKGMRAPSTKTGFLLLPLVAVENAALFRPATAAVAAARAALVADTTPEWAMACCLVVLLREWKRILYLPGCL